MWLTSLHMCIHGLSTLKTYKLTCLHSPNLFNSQENLVLSKLEVDSLSKIGRLGPTREFMNEWASFIE